MDNEDLNKMSKPCNVNNKVPKLRASARRRPFLGNKSDKRNRQIQSDQQQQQQHHGRPQAGTPQDADVQKCSHTASAPREPPECQQWRLPAHSTQTPNVLNRHPSNHAITGTTHHNGPAPNASQCTCRRRAPGSSTQAHHTQRQGQQVGGRGARQESSAGMHAG